MREIKHFFQSDGLRIAGTLHLPSVSHPPLVVGCHGLFSSMQSPKQIALANGFVKRNIAYLRLDHRGCGESEGVFEEVTTLEGRSKDITDAVFSLKKEENLGEQLGLFGSSFGGAAVLRAAKKLPTQAIAVLATPLSIRTDSHWAKILSESKKIHPEARNITPENLEYDLARNLDDISNILILHGEQDNVVPVENARMLYEQAEPPKCFISFPEGDHPLSMASHQGFFMHSVLKWMETCFWKNGWKGIPER